MNLDNMNNKIKNTSLTQRLWGVFGIASIVGFSYVAIETVKLYNSTMNYIHSQFDSYGVKYGEDIISDPSTGYFTHNELIFMKDGIEIKFIDGIDEIPAIHEDYYKSNIEEIIITTCDSTKRIIFDNHSPKTHEDVENMLKFYGANEFYNNTRRSYVKYKFQEQFEKNEYNLIKN